MPKINGPDLGKGFWIASGVLLALLVFGLASMMLRSVTAKRNAG